MKQINARVVPFVLLVGALFCQLPVRALGRAEVRLAPPAVQARVTDNRVTSRLLPVAALAAAQTAVGERSGDGIWEVANEQLVPIADRRSNVVGPHAVVRLLKPALDAQLSMAPLEGDSGATGGAVVITLPLPDGRFGRFRIEDSPIFVPELAAAFPEIKTYRGSGLDDPTATARFDWTADGFHAIVIAATGTIYIDPYSSADLSTYVSFSKADFRTAPGNRFVCLVDGQRTDSADRVLNTFPLTNGTIKRTYRLALAATGEYTAAAGGTKLAALSRIVTTMNRVNGIYERELSVRMTVATGTVGDPTALIYTDGATDPYTNNNGTAMLVQNQTNLDTVVGTANYDIGHVFSTGGGGIATLSGPCNVATKARGVTGLPNPVGDAFDVDYVAHEMGHQFGGSHTFNSTAGNCSGNRSASHAYEVGGGASIMAYAGICSPEDLQSNSNDLFHVESLNEITAFLTAGGGATCGVTTATGNSVPTVTVAAASATIPIGTPFTLTAAATDTDADALTYNWEQYSLGTASSSVVTASTDDGSRPLFRPYAATVSPSRTFPSLTYILNNANVPPQTYSCVIGTCLTGETLPATARTMTFQVTVRDNRSGAGAIATASTQVTTTTAAGPFAVASPNTAVSWTGNSTQVVTWNVANTAAPPVSAANVRISLSTNGGTTFPTVLAASVPNSGTANVTVPNTPTTTARIKVEAVGNIFFDLSNADFTIVSGPAAPPPAPTGVSASPTGPARVSLRWSPSPTATSYTVKRGLAPGAETTLTAGITTTSYLDTAVSSGQRYYYVISASNGAGESTNSAEVSVLAGASVNTSSNDVDGDGQAELTVWRPGVGTWLWLTSGSGYGYAAAGARQWGNDSAGDVPMMGDIDGDGEANLIVWRASTGTWFWLTSSSGYDYAASGARQWGNHSLGDVPMVGDVDGDGRADLIVWRPGTGTWYWLTSSSGYDYGVSGAKQWGNQALGDVPLVGDVDGDKKADLMMWRASTGTWYWLTSSSGYDYAVYGAKQWGSQGAADAPLLGDVDGDGKANLLVWRASTGTWFWLTSSSSYDYAAAGTTQWGNQGLGDVPLLGDIDGDRKADLVIWRASTGTWFWLTSSTGYDYSVYGARQWGNQSLGDVPILKW